MKKQALIGIFCIITVYILFEQTNTEKSKEFVFLINNNKVIIHASINGLGGFYILDTKAPGMILLSELFFYTILRNKIVTIQELNPKFDTYYLFKFDELYLFGHKYTDKVFKTNFLSPKDSARIIGLELLQRHDLVSTDTGLLYFYPLFPNILYDLFFSDNAQSIGFCNG